MPRISEFLNKQNFIDITGYIYDKWESGLNNYFMKNILLLDKLGNFREPSSLYVNDGFSGKNLFWESGNDNKFLHDDYLTLAKEKKDFFSFLIDLGVIETPALFEIKSKEFKSLSQYFNPLTKTMQSYFTMSLKESALDLDLESINIQDLSFEIREFYHLDFLECCIDNNPYSKIFWEYFIKDKVNVIDKLQKNPLLTVAFNEKTYPIKIQSFLQYLFKYTNIIPTTLDKCLKSNEIYTIGHKDKYYSILKGKIPLMSVDLPTYIIDKLQFKTSLSMDTIKLILSSLVIDDPNLFIIIELCYFELYKIYLNYSNFDHDIKLLSKLNTFENSNSLYYINPKFLTSDFDDKIGNLAPIYLPEVIVNEKGLIEFLRFLNIHIVDKDSIDIEIENKDENCLNWLKELFLSRLPYFSQILLKNTQLKAVFKSIDNIIYLGKRIKFIKVSSLKIKYKGQELMKPLTYLECSNDNNCIIYCKLNESVKNINEINCIEFICKEITNFISVSNNYAIDLYSLLLLKEMDIKDYISQKGIKY
jgi:hypothetical protein